MTKDDKGNIVEVNMEKPIITKEVIHALDYLFSKFAGHSDYHGDKILSAIVCVKEGKEIKSVRPLEH